MFGMKLVYSSVISASFPLHIASANVNTPPQKCFSHAAAGAPSDRYVRKLWGQGFPRNSHLRNLWVILQLGVLRVQVLDASCRVNSILYMRNTVEKAYIYTAVCTGSIWDGDCVAWTSTLIPRQHCRKKDSTPTNEALPGMHELSRATLYGSENIPRSPMHKNLTKVPRDEVRQFLVSRQLQRADVSALSRSVHNAPMQWDVDCYRHCVPEGGS